MASRLFKAVLVLALGQALSSGCARLHRQARTVREKPPASRAVKAPAEWPAEKLAKAHAHYGAGVICEMNNEPEAALAEFELAALNDPENESLVLDVSRRLIQKKDFEKARDLLEQAAGRPGASGAVYARLGQVYGQLGKAEQAVAADRTAIKRAPTLLAGYQNLFTTLMQGKKHPEALRTLDEAAAQQKVGPEFLVGAAELYNSYGIQVPSEKPKIKSRAVALLNRAEKLNPENPLIRLRLADGFSAQGESSQAASLYLDLLKRLPDVPPIREQLHAKLATIYLRESDRTNAVEQLEAIVRDNPTNPQAYYYLGYLTYTEKKPAQAAEYFKKAIILNPDFAEAYYDLALAQLSQNKPADALATLETARKKFSENFALEFYSAVAYSEQKDYASALKHFTSAEVIAKTTEPRLLDRDFYFQAGACAERTGEYQRAEEYFEKCLKLDPDWPEALNYLGYMWAERGEHLDRAREMLEKAVKAEPKNAAFLDSLAWVYHKQNEHEEALKYAQKAVDLTEKPDATLYDHLGDIYAALKEPQRASEAWSKSLELEPNLGIQTKLEKLKR